MLLFQGVKLHFRPTQVSFFRLIALRILTECDNIEYNVWCKSVGIALLFLVCGVCSGAAEDSTEHAKEGFAAKVQICRDEEVILRGEREKLMPWFMEQSQETA